MMARHGSMPSATWIVAARRTAIGRLGGGLKDVSPRTLGTVVMRGTLAAANVPAERIEEVVLGQVFQGGHNNLARLCSVDAGVPVGVPAAVVNQQCGSGLAAIQWADRLIRCGERDVVLAGGLESMSQVPFILRALRWGSRLGHAEAEDELISGLTCGLSGLRMGETAENIAARHGIDRAEQDAFALASQTKALDAIRSRRFAEEIVPVPVPGKKHEATPFLDDEHPRETSLEQLAALKTAFASGAGGTVTAGNASGLNDGAAAVVLASTAAVERNGWKPLARVLSGAVTGIDPAYMGLGPVRAIQAAVDRAGLTLEDIDLVEINEAFAAQVLGVLREVPVPESKLNVNGGAIALGHPVGCSGARIVVTLVHEMRRRGARRGLAAACIGGGMGSAVIVELAP